MGSANRPGHERIPKALPRPAMTRYGAMAGKFPGHQGGPYSWLCGDCRTNRPGR